MKKKKKKSHKGFLFFPFLVCSIMAGKSNTTLGGNLFWNRLNKKSYPTVKEMEKQKMQHRLCLDLVLATEHVVNIGEVVSARLQSLGLAGGLEVLL